MDNIANINPTAINELLEFQIVEPNTPAVTIYFPMHTSGNSPNTNEDQIRCKNLTHQAIDALYNHPQGERLAHELSQWLEAILQEPHFWGSQTKGLLLCARPGFLRLFHLPIDTEEHVAVANRFQLAPILGLAQDMQEYYVLMLAQHKPQLLKGDAYTLAPFSVGFPSSLTTGLNIDEMTTKSEQQRSSGSSATHFNGRGGAKNTADAERIRFWRLLDNLIINNANHLLPLIIAGVDAEIAEYRYISHYPKIMNAAIHGNYANSNMPAIFDMAEAAVCVELLDAAHQSAVAEYERAKGQSPKQAAHKLAAIRTAAENGRIDKLLLPTLRDTTDTINDNMKHVPVVSFPFKNSIAQAVHDIASMVWSSHGQVIEIAPEQMPEHGAAALATLRY